MIVVQQPRCLTVEYGYHREQSHAFLSNHFWTNGYGSGKSICLRHAFNHSLFKVLALQALHGWEQYLIVFKTNPTMADAQYYCEVGLVWCTEKTVSSLLATIDLCAHGVYFPFVLRTTKYSVTVQPNPDPAHADLTRSKSLFPDEQSLKPW